MSGAHPQYSLNLIGPFRLFGADGERIDIPSKKGAALLAALATASDGERTRSWLQEKLWGTRQQSQAQGSLRRELSNLRKHLNVGPRPLLICDHDRVRLDLERLSLDIRDDILIGSQDFLEGLDIAGEEGFEEWLREQRNALNARAARVRAPAEPASFAPREESPPAIAPRAVAGAEASPRPTVAVLRFGASSSQEDLYLAEGIAEEILSGLSRSRLLSVCSRHLSLTLNPLGQDASDVCARLGVKYVVQGQLRRRPGGGLRISVFLVDGDEDRTVWSEHYDRPVDDILAVQDEIVGAIIGTLEPALLGHEEIQSLRGGARSLRHWELFMRGRWHFWRATFGHWASARDFLSQALALEPDDVPTLSHLSLCMLGEVWAGMVPEQDRDAQIAEAHVLALRAVSNDPLDAYAHYVLGTVFSMQGRLEQAEAEQRRALEINPYLAPALGEQARLWVFLGRLDEAIAQADRAIASSPNDPHLFLWFRSKALAKFAAGRPADAVRDAADACARSPHQFFLHYLLAACHAAAGDTANAAVALAEGRRLQPAYTEEMVRLAHPFRTPEHLVQYLAALRKAGWAPSQT